MLLVNRLVGAVLVLAMLVISVPNVEASALSERLAERRAELQERLAERRAALQERLGQNSPTDSGNEDTSADEALVSGDEDVEEAAPCRCSVRLGYSKPQLQFSNGTLTFVPRMDVMVRSRGDFEAPGWTALLNYSGQSSYASDDVSLPNGVTFAGSQDLFSGSCGTNYNFKGRQLPPVSLSGVVSGLVGLDQELTGTVRMDAELSACGESDHEQRQFSFTWRDLFNLRTGGWRSAR